MYTIYRKVVYTVHIIFLLQCSLTAFSIKLIIVTKTSMPASHYPTCLHLNCIFFVLLSSHGSFNDLLSVSWKCQYASLHSVFGLVVFSAWKSLLPDFVLCVLLVNQLLAPLLPTKTPWHHFFLKELPLYIITIWINILNLPFCFWIHNFNLAYTNILNAYISQFISIIIDGY